MYTAKLPVGNGEVHPKTGSSLWMNPYGSLVLHPTKTIGDGETLNGMFELIRSQDWSHHESDLSNARPDINSLEPYQLDFLIKFLAYQTYLDSAQQQEPSKSLGSLVSTPECQALLNVYQLSETIHSKTYNVASTEMLPNQDMLNERVRDPKIQERALTMTKYYDEGSRLGARYILDPYGVSEDPESFKTFIRLLSNLNIMEGIRFYVTFLAHFSWGGRLTGKKPKLVPFLVAMKSIARDEAVHLVMTQHFLNRIKSGKEGDYFRRAFEEVEEECMNMLVEARIEEENFVDYAFEGRIVNGVSPESAKEYVNFITTTRALAIFEQSKVKAFLGKNFSLKNPHPWMSEYLTSKSITTAQQEKEGNAYAKNVKMSLSKSLNIL